MSLDCQKLQHNVWVLCLKCICVELRMHASQACSSQRSMLQWSMQVLMHAKQKCMHATILLAPFEVHIAHVTCMLA